MRDEYVINKEVIKFWNCSQCGGFIAMDRSSDTPYPSWRPTLPHLCSQHGVQK